MILIHVMNGLPNLIFFAISFASNMFNVRLVGEIKIVIEKTRVDRSKVRLAECEVGDETGTVSLRARDDQIDLLQQISKSKDDDGAGAGAVVLRNCSVELYQGKFIRLAISKWGKISSYPDGIKSTPPPPSSMNSEVNLSIVDLNDVAGDEWFEASSSSSMTAIASANTNMNISHHHQNQYHHQVRSRRDGTPGAAENVYDPYTKEAFQHQQSHHAHGHHPRHMKHPHHNQRGGGGSVHGGNHSHNYQNHGGGHRKGGGNFRYNEKRGQGGGTHGGGQAAYIQHGGGGGLYAPAPNSSSMQIPNMNQHQHYQGHVPHAHTHTHTHAPSMSDYSTIYQQHPSSMAHYGFGAQSAVSGPGPGHPHRQPPPPPHQQHYNPQQQQQQNQQDYLLLQMQMEAMQLYGHGQRTGLGSSQVGYSHSRMESSRGVGGNWNHSNVTTEPSSGMSVSPSVGGAVRSQVVSPGDYSGRGGDYLHSNITPSQSNDDAWSIRREAQSPMMNPHAATFISNYAMPSEFLDWIYLYSYYIHIHLFCFVRLHCFKVTTFAHL